jgi:chitinase
MHDLHSVFITGAEDLGGKPSDKEHFSLLTEELSEVFAPRGWLLSAAVSPSRFRLEDAYDVHRLAHNLDFINLMTFDLHAERDRTADHHAPLLQRKHDKGLNVFYSVVSIQVNSRKMLIFPLLSYHIQTHSQKLMTITFPQLNACC